MKKSTLINKFESKLDAALEALYDARDVVEDTGEIDTEELNSTIENIEEQIADASEKVRELIEDIVE
jgi:hypothetical protein